MMPHNHDHQLFLAKSATFDVEVRAHMAQAHPTIKQAIEHCRVTLNAGATDLQHRAIIIEFINLANTLYQRKCKLTNYHNNSMQVYYTDGEGRMKQQLLQGRLWNEGTLQQQEQIQL